MWEWLVSPIDPGRLHDISHRLGWHGRLMMFGWGVLTPVAVLVARFAKILPWQNWPDELDNPTWWHFHWFSLTLVVTMTFFALGLVIGGDSGLGGAGHLHNMAGYLLIGLGVMQMLSGLLRGTKGGPTAPGRDGSWSGDHYDMTVWRRGFEWLHKSVGYLVLCLAVYTILTGLWEANAPNWMFLTSIAWWILLIILFMLLQRGGFAIETYQAIWGPNPVHPGNRMPPHGWRVRRPSDIMEKNEPGE